MKLTNINMKPMNSTISLFARIFLSVLFIASGAGKLSDTAATTAFIELTLPWLPVASAVTLLVAFLELIAGLMILVGYKTKWAAVALFVFLIAVNFLFHSPFTGDQIQITAFLKNLSIMGGLLLLIGHGPGLLTVEALMSKSGSSKTTSHDLESPPEHGSDSGNNE
jgi:putative oxidoreductase